MAVVQDGGEKTGGGKSQGGAKAQEERKACLGSLPHQNLVADDVVGLQDVSEFPNVWFYRELIAPFSYLPPPVLEVLNNKQLEAAKRAGTSRLDTLNTERLTCSMRSYDHLGP